MNVIVTGSSRGIGKAIALEYIKENARVIICGRCEEVLKKLADEVRESGKELYYEVLDVTDREAVKAFTEKIEKQYGTIDIWINNAGVSVNKKYMDFTEQDYDLMADINMKAVFFCTRTAAEVMKRHGGGVIINASSYQAIIPYPTGAVYAATKSAVCSFTRSTAAALAPFHIRVLSYIPGMIVTEMSTGLLAGGEEPWVRDMAIGRLGKPEDIAGPVVFLSSDRASFMTGVSVEIDGGKFAVQDCSMAFRTEEKGSTGL